MKRITDALARTALRTTALIAPLLVGATGTAAADTGGSYAGVMMGGGWGLFGGAMGLGAVLWMAVLLAVPALLVYSLVAGGSTGDGDRPLSVLRERYARGEITDEEFDRRREAIERST